jgi:hypothetical protein
MAFFDICPVGTTTIFLTSIVHDLLPSSLRKYFWEILSLLGARHERYNRLIIHDQILGGIIF